ncbi:hypothetical protein Q4543_19475 [Salipiger sp. 1_MG-2023]|uniref:DUF6950 family protein n=1 Tax=Salipiger sp. 1_MG-2023 TaxID=3062665 RepID=UPI0026E1C26F|nr:hypothetical protein [Salipiger sp. 1_MG-2023]MDO6587696.1 hypothetical protein [Salipiger sp. 1_MG-2023]
MTEIIPEIIPMQPLFRELNRWAHLPFVWGESDCCTVLADWVQVVTGRDPAAHVRGMYATRGECQRETGYLRDPVACIASCLDTIGGLPRSDCAMRRGDIGVYRYAGDRWAFGGIWTGEHWATHMDQGVAFRASRAVEVLAAWGVGYEA